MSQYYHIHPDDPQIRLITHSVDIIREGGVIAYPTDSCYALGCQIGNKAALTKIRQIRRLNEKHNFTLVCRDLSELGTYAKVNNSAYRLLKSHTPGAYTFILPASREVPRRLVHPKRKTIGLRVPANPICLALLEALDEPLMSTSLILPGDDYPLMDPLEIRDRLEGQIDLIIDGGFGGMEITTMVNMVPELPQIMREGKGDAAPFLP
ncbi:MAG: L-threonylcarbamoyladenylate synthase [Pseudomonadales bacterium]|jgi:tRNA threonylcarbamoyl adenosine modification protein (Sua5/YciO/YrdC/YwlC family)|nr:L-threonylcarbamoyladenylate synthase [Pseudomonadales bacterium]MDP7595436.1 L-threonylcarbamoyladenylate synthase [Pseudomonadales bacterium]HJN49669.1 L-threonylcarbamoyladenylate synthase [Pseudomonadales bacterium]|tara:strand:+ start:294 stop:917 length:624 start_codon:yes stop_codon:yes gene_type:complete